MSSLPEHVDPHVLRKYEIQEKLGKGAYGVVWRAINKETGQQVALKKIFDAFHNPVDAQRTYREVMILKQLKSNAAPNIVGLFELFPSENDKDIYLTFEYMEADLLAVLRAGILGEPHKQWIMYQMLKALKYLHTGSVVHRDLKPSNLLVDSECNCKLCDFGLSRSTDNLQEDEAVMTDYVATRWYRAPEILLGSTKYTTAIDMWSCGCILGELMLGKPPFQGTSTMDQVEKVVQLVGSPTDEDIAAIDSPFAQTILDTITGDGSEERVTWEQKFPSTSPECLDMMKALLMFNPNTRMTIEEALAHPWMAQFHNEKEEPAADGPIMQHVNDSEKLSSTDYRMKLYEQADMSGLGQPSVMVTADTDSTPAAKGDKDADTKDTDKTDTPPVEVVQVSEDLEVGEDADDSTLIDDDEAQEDVEDLMMPADPPDAGLGPRQMSQNMEVLRKRTSVAQMKTDEKTPTLESVTSKTVEFWKDSVKTATQQTTATTIMTYLPNLTNCAFVSQVMPNFDSVAASIALAHMHQGTAMLGARLNRESVFALHHFNVPIPPLCTTGPKDVCLIGHSKQALAHPHVTPAQVVGIIDHHAVTAESMCVPRTLQIDIRPWGSVSAIVAHMYLATGVEVPKHVAGLLLSGILSATLNLRSPRTTDWDGKMVAAMACVCGIEDDIDSLADLQFKAKCRDIDSVSIHALVVGNLKVYKPSQIQQLLGVSIIHTDDASALVARQKEIIEEMRAVKAENDIGLLILCVVNSAFKRTQMLLCGKPELSLIQDSFKGKVKGPWFSFKTHMNQRGPIVDALIGALKNSWTFSDQNGTSNLRTGRLYIVDAMMNGYIVREGSADAARQDRQASRLKKGFRFRSRRGTGVSKPKSGRSGSAAPDSLIIDLNAGNSMRSTSRSAGSGSGSQGQ